MDIKVSPSKASGMASAPPSKSIAHRMLICAALAEGTSHIDNIAYSQDILASIDCIRAMGAEVTAEGSHLTVVGTAGTPNVETDFMCRESGSTMRFFMGVAMLKDGEKRFYGSETLRNRPFSVYEDICNNQGIEFEKCDGYIRINGKIKSGEYVLPGNISSQFISGLLFTLPLLEGDSTIRLTNGVESRSYIDLTLQAMALYGVDVVWADDCTLSISGGQQYRCVNSTVEGDCSNAAFLEALNVLGGKVTVTGLNQNTSQGDRVYAELYEQLKAGYANIDISDCPDLGPVLFTLAAVCNGAKFTGTARLKIKESDRGQVMCDELANFGVDTVMEDNSIEIKKCELHAPDKVISGHNDHRIVMSMVTLMSVTGGELTGAEAVNKSYPNYFDVVRALGIEVEYAVDNR